MRRWTSETTRRALRTFLQAFLAYLLAGIPLIDFADTSTLRTVGIGLLVSAIAAGIAAVMNLEYIPNGKPCYMEDVDPSKGDVENG